MYQNHCYLDRLSTFYSLFTLLRYLMTYFPSTYKYNSIKKNKIFFPTIKNELTQPISHCAMDNEKKSGKNSFSSSIICSSLQPKMDWKILEHNRSITRSAQLGRHTGRSSCSQNNKCNFWGRMINDQINNTIPFPYWPQIEWRCALPDKC